MQKPSPRSRSEEYFVYEISEGNVINRDLYGEAMLVPIRMSTTMASPYKSLWNWVKHFFGYLVYEIFLWPESWRGSLHIYLLSFPRFWILSIERFWFLFWSILNGVTLKTTNLCDELCCVTTETKSSVSFHFRATRICTGHSRQFGRRISSWTKSDE